MAGAPRIEELLAAARDRRHRYDLYRARVYGPQPATMTRLMERERADRGAEARLRRAQQKRAPRDHGRGVTGAEPPRGAPSPVG